MYEQTTDSRFCFLKYFKLGNGYAKFCTTPWNMAVTYSKESSDFSNFLYFKSICIADKILRSHCKIRFSLFLAVSWKIVFLVLTNLGIHYKKSKHFFLEIGQYTVGIKRSVFLRGIQKCKLILVKTTAQVRTRNLWVSLVIGSLCTEKRYCHRVQ
jgi:hypothetical protein